MKKKIAIFANGWGTEYLREIVSGAFEIASQMNMDIFSFINFSTTSNFLQDNAGEVNIFNLADIKDFDGVIFLGNSFNSDEEFKYIYENVIKREIPAISLEYEMEGVLSITTDNYYGMHELALHIIEEHQAKNIIFVAGPKKHNESNIRMQAVLDAMQEKNLLMPKENIIYGNWEQDQAGEKVAKWIEQKKTLPDAIVCANDIMAIGVFEMLQEKGYNVPKDVILTGYDCIEVGREHDPVITSVSHEWHTMGNVAMKAVCNLIEGKEVKQIEPVKALFVKGTSCGCQDEESETIRKNIGRKRFYKGFDAWHCDTHFRDMFQAVRKVENAELLHEHLSTYFDVQHWMEGDSFRICLEPEFFDIEEKDENLSSVGYNPNVDVICGLFNGTVIDEEVIPIKEAMFGYAESTKAPCVTFFVPLSSEGKNYGFAMVQDNIDIILANRLYIWTRHLNQYLEYARHNFVIADLMKKLTNLSVTDTLTGVYNRAGCEKIAYPMLEQYKKDGECGVVMMADIDRMKRINDDYGHECGDLALRIVANALKTQVPSTWIVSRFGGDEFFIGGKLEPSIDLDKIIKAITNKLEAEGARRKIVFELTVSIGYAIIDPASDMSVEKYLQKADKLMYVVKKCHHEASER